MLLGIHFPMNYVIIDQLVFNLVDICLDNMLQILHKSIYALLQKLGRLTTWLVKFSMFNFRIVYLTQSSTDFNNLDLKI